MRVFVKPLFISVFGVLYNVPQVIKFLFCLLACGHTKTRTGPLVQGQTSALNLIKTF